MEPTQSAAGHTAAQPDGYLAFIPAVLPPVPELAFDAGAVALHAEASAALGRLQGVAEAIPNRDLFLGMYVRKEAVLSSQIEDIECTLDEVLRFEEGGPDDPGLRLQDVSQVVNYVRAVNVGFDELARNRAITLDLLRHLHEILAPDSERPGQFRDKQNWIGSRARDTDVRKARYVPPPIQEMHERLVNLAYYMNEHRGVAPLLRAAIAHAQFETIHPFDDGNGRIGRILVTLVLRAQGVLDYPLLYLSLFLKNNRREYYDRLTLIRERGAWIEWINFFLQGVRDTAEEAVALAKAVTALRNEAAPRLATMPANTARVFDILFQHPIVYARAVQRHTGLGFEGAHAALARLQAGGWIKEITGQRRNRMFRFEPYLTIMEADRHG